MFHDRPWLKGVLGCLVVFVVVILCSSCAGTAFYALWPRIQIVPPSIAVEQQRRAAQPAPTRVAQFVPPTPTPQVVPRRQPALLPTASSVGKSGLLTENCSNVQNPGTEFFRTSDKRTITKVTVLPKDGKDKFGSSIDFPLGSVIQDYGVIIYTKTQEALNNKGIVDNVKNGYAYWIEPGVNQFNPDFSTGKVTTVKNGQYLFLSAGEGILQLNQPGQAGYEYFLGQKDKPVAREWYVVIHTDERLGLQELNVRCMVASHFQTNLFPAGKTLSEGYLLDQIQPTLVNHNKDEVSLVVIDQVSGYIAVYTKTGISGIWIKEMTNLK